MKSSRPTFIQIGQPRRDSAVARAFGVGIVEGYKWLRHEFILPEWCLLCAPDESGGASRQGDRAQLSSPRPCPDVVDVHASNQWAWRISRRRWTGGGDAHLVVRAAPAQPAFQFAQDGGRKRRGHRAGAKGAAGPRLNVDIEQDVLPGFQGFSTGASGVLHTMCHHSAKMPGFPAAEEFFDREKW